MDAFPDDFTSEQACLAKYDKVPELRKYIYDYIKSMLAQNREGAMLRIGTHNIITRRVVISELSKRFPKRIYIRENFLIEESTERFVRLEDSCIYGEERFMKDEYLVVLDPNVAYYTISCMDAQRMCWQEQ